MNRAFAVALACILLVSMVGFSVAEPYTVSDAEEEAHFQGFGPGTIADQVHGVTWAKNGEVLYVTALEGNGGFEGLFQFNVSTPYTLSSVSGEFVAEHNVGQTNLWGTDINNDGTSLYLVDRDSDNVIQANLSTAYELSSNIDQNSVDVSAQTSNPRGVAWNDDGTKLFIADDSQIHQYAASTAFDISTISHTQSASLQAAANGIDFNETGTTLFVAYGGEDKVAEFNLSTGYDVSTLSHVSNKSVHTPSGSGPDGLDLYQQGSRFVYFDGSNDDGHVYSMMDATVSGTVKYASNETVIEGASITVNDSSISDTTDANGFYSLDLDNGTHTITATIDGRSGSTTVTVDGADLTDQNITIGASGLELDVTTFMEHGSSQTYQVFLTQGGETTDVTADANTTVTSGDVSVITVDESAATLTAVDDESVNQQVTITVEYNDLSTTEDVTVSNKTLNNIGILPPATWPIAIIGQPGDTTGSSGTWPGAIQLQWLFVAMAVGAIVSWASANPFMGLGTVEFMLLFGWVISWISDGMLIASIIFLVYASLSLTDIASGNLGHR